MLSQQIFFLGVIISFLFIPIVGWDGLRIAHARHPKTFTRKWYRIGTLVDLADLFILSVAAAFMFPVIETPHAWIGEYMIVFWLMLLASSPVIILAVIARILLFRARHSPSGAI